MLKLLDLPGDETEIGLSRFSNQETIYIYIFGCASLKKFQILNTLLESSPLSFTLSKSDQTVRRKKYTNLIAERMTNRQKRTERI